MPLRRLVNFLDRNSVGYMTINHPRAVTAQEVAQESHISGKELAKTVIIKIDGELAMAVTSADRAVDLESLRRNLHVGSIDLAGEGEFDRLFPECETGAMPPFGNLYGMRVFLDRILAADEQIAFIAGNHREVILMPYHDYERLVRPAVVSFSGQA
jgi:Ala-tRNA(Pro) deacylase